MVANKRRILLHSRPVLSVPLRELVARSRREHPDIDWSVLAYSNADGSVRQFADLVGADRVYSLQPELRREMSDTVPYDLSVLHGYRGSAYAAVCTSKEEWGSRALQQRTREYQLSLVQATHRIYRRVLETDRPDFVLIAIPEQYDSLILLELCYELGVQPMIYAHARTLSRSYFTDALDERLPARTFQTDPDPASRAEAEDFVANFRREHREPFTLPPAELVQPLPVPATRRALPVRAVRTAIRSSRRFARRAPDHEPHVVDRYTIARMVSIHYIDQVQVLRQLRSRLRRHLFDMASVQEPLPQDFLFYPLQVTPEQSIDAQAPFFRDQLRAIDLLLLNLPADWLLLVKEHPAMAGKRRVSLYHSLRRRPGVILVDPGVPSRFLIEHARVTVSVTGTASLEAFLLGRSSLLLGKTFFSPWVRSLDLSGPLRRDLLRAAAEPPQDAQVVDMVARVFSIGRSFVLYPPSGHELDPTGVMNERNMSEMMRAVVEHIRSTEPAAGPA